MKAPLRKAAYEAVVIVSSILLAFWIDAWAQTRHESEVERYYLELLREDLAQNAVQFEAFKEFTAARAEAAARAYRTLAAGETADRRTLANDMFLATNRRTVAMTRAAYTDLISTGNLRLIENRRLRNAIIRYYERADIFFEVIRRNDAIYVDGMAVDAILRSGLVLGRDAIVEGIDSELPEHRLLRMRLDAPELDAARAALRVRWGVGDVANQRADSIIQGARALRALVSAELDGNVGTPTP